MQEVRDNNLFIEGIQGSGKTTLLTALQYRKPNYRSYREGDLSPIALTWCSYMTKAEYEKICRTYSEIVKEIERYTLIEGDKRIVSYTQILTDIPAFHKVMEKFEIYNGGVSAKRFQEILLERYENFQGGNHLFECSFFQNILETFLLYEELEEEEILEFYKKAYKLLENKGFKLLYLEIRDKMLALERIKAERIDEKGGEVWFLMMSQYLEQSPYGRKKGLKGLEGMIHHLERRSALEHKIMAEIIGDKALIIPSRHYDLEQVIQWCDNY